MVGWQYRTRHGNSINEKQKAFIICRFALGPRQTAPRNAVGRQGEPGKGLTVAGPIHPLLALSLAGLDGLTLHGLRRSFASLTEWLEIPAGLVAQIMGHKPSATAEKHYKVRPLELLRLHHERKEAWILEQAAVVGANSGVLREVAR